MRTGLPILLAACLGAALNWPRLPDAAALDAPTERFSAARALKHVATWANAPRPTGSQRHAEVVNAIETELVRLGFEVDRQQTGRLTNLAASAPGDGPGGVWLVAHSDSVAEGPGAADDGLGLGVIVETLRALSADGPRHGVHALITDGEEAGLLGAAAFVATAPPAARVAINIEARGTEGPAYMFQTAGDSPQMLQAWGRSGCDAQATSLARTVYDQLPNDTDFTVLRAAGWWGYDFALLGGAWRYHTPEDTPANLDPRSVQQVGDCVLGLATAWVGRVGEGGELCTWRPPWYAIPPAYAQVLGGTRVVPAWVISLFGAAALFVLPRPDRRALRGAAAFFGAGLTVAVASGLLMAAAVFLWPGFMVRTAEIPEPRPLYFAAFFLGLGGLWLGRRRSAGGWGIDAPAILLAALAAVFSPVAAYILVPGAWTAALRLRGWGAAAVLPAFVAGLLLGPLYSAIYPALTTRMLPVLAMLPFFTLGWLFTKPAAKPADTQE
ncbi:hypothetical protein LBMAG42_35900 [Deltaproteobacteria bacterium]|nr:hypothetical protein LBMAG42_35900 [Deltaproteobacteria bacterium]